MLIWCGARFAHTFPQYNELNITGVCNVMVVRRREAIVLIKLSKKRQLFVPPTPTPDWRNDTEPEESRGGLLLRSMGFISGR